MTIGALIFGTALSEAGTGWGLLRLQGDQVFMGGALAVAVIGAIIDVRSRRIPNRLTYSAMLIALAGRTILQGWHGLGSGLAGAVIGGGAFLAFFLVHAMGAGDVKLITAVGCMAGASATVEILLASAIAGGIFAILYSLWLGKLRTVLGNVWDLICFHSVAGAEQHPNLNLSNPQATRMPYGVAIAAGVLYSVLALYRRGGI